jgi:excisionase family DNA binding protein
MRYIDSGVELPTKERHVAGAHRMNHACDASTSRIPLTPDAGRCPKMTEVTEVLTTEEAAQLLRVSTKTVLALARAGSLPGEKVGRAWRFLRADLLEYVHGRPDFVASAAS